MTSRKIKILDIPSELGAGTRGSSLGPASVQLYDAERGSRIYNRFPHDILFSNNDLLSTQPKYPMAKYIETLYDVHKVNSERLEQELEEGNFPLLLTGDHSNALAGISALVNTYPDKRVGVIWIDAHADLHTPYTSPSGNIHGMPLGAALGKGYRSIAINEVPKEVEKYWTKMTTLGSKKITPMIYPGDLVFIDIRDLQDQEWEDIDDNNIKFFVPARLQNKEIADVGSYALNYLKHCDYIYCSFDVDSMDPVVSKGTGTSVENGLTLDQAQELLGVIWKSPKLKTLEITEINPLMDDENSMAKAVVAILDSFL